MLESDISTLCGGPKCNLRTLISIKYDEFMMMMVMVIIMMMMIMMMIRMIVIND